MSSYPLDLSNLPDYTNDLNAIHKVEIKWRQNKTDAELLKHINILDEICRCHPNQVGDAAFATAEQRCEAVIKVIGKWKNK